MSTITERAIAVAHRHMREGTPITINGVEIGIMEAFNVYGMDVVVEVLADEVMAGDPATAALNEPITFPQSVGVDLHALKSELEAIPGMSPTPQPQTTKNRAQRRAEAKKNRKKKRGR